MKPCTGELNKEGFLSKKRTTRWPHQYQKRFFTLKGARLEWSQEKGGETLGVVDLTKLKLQQESNQAGSPAKIPSTLEFEALQTNKHRTRSFCLKADTPEELEEWREALQEIHDGSPVLQITKLTVESSNDVSRSVAKIGDTVRMEVVTSEDILPPTIKIGSSLHPVEASPVGTVSEKGGGSSWTTSFEVTPEIQVQGPLQFHVECEPQMHYDCVGQARQKVSTMEPIQEPGGKSGANIMCEMIPVEVNALKISSNNPGNPKLATTGHIVSAVLEVNKAILKPTIEIGDRRLPCSVCALSPGSDNDVSEKWTASLKLEPEMGFETGPVAILATNIVDRAGNTCDDVYQEFSRQEVEGEGGEEAGVMFLGGLPAVTSFECGVVDGEHSPVRHPETGKLLSRVGVGERILTTVKFTRPVRNVQLALNGGQTVVEASVADAANDSYTTDDGHVVSTDWTISTIISEELAAPIGQQNNSPVLHTAMTVLNIRLNDGYKDEVGAQGIGSEVVHELVVARPYLKDYSSSPAGNLSLWILDVLNNIQGLSDAHSQGIAELYKIDVRDSRLKKLKQLGALKGSERELMELLKDGVVLCWLSAIIANGGADETHPQILEAATRVSKVTTDPLPPDGGEFDHAVLQLRAKHRENVGAFLMACKAFELPAIDTFIPEDLTDSLRADQVMKCLNSLGRHCYHVAGYTGPIIGAPHSNTHKKRANTEYQVTTNTGLWGKAGGGHTQVGPNTRVQSASLGSRGESVTEQAERLVQLSPASAIHKAKLGDIRVSPPKQSKQPLMGTKPTSPTEGENGEWVMC